MEASQSKRMDRKRSENKFAGLQTTLHQTDLMNIITSESLHYLPAKSLARFEAVSREWKRHITSPFFAHKQSNKFRELSGFFVESDNNNNNNGRIFISLDPTAYGVPDPSLSFLPEPVEIRASSNGLLCCKARKVGGDGVPSLAGGAYYITNPATKAWKKLPEPSRAHGPDPALILIFNPSPLNFVADYRLLCACPRADLKNGYEFEMYDSKNGSWMAFDKMYRGAKKLSTMSGVHVGGTAYWLSTEGGEILALDLAAKQSEFIRGHGPIGVIGGELCSLKVVDHNFVQVHRLDEACTCTLALSNPAKAWRRTKVFDVWSLGPLENGSLSLLEKSMKHILYVGETWVLLMDESNRLCLYHIFRGEFRWLHDYVVDAGFKVVPYVNSLVEI